MRSGDKKSSMFKPQCLLEQSRGEAIQRGLYLDKDVKRRGAFCLSGRNLGIFIC